MGSVGSVGSPAVAVELTEGVVRRLLAGQHPDLASLPLSEVPSGWDNALWRLGDELAVRLPRTAVAAPLTINEQRWLPELAARLPLPVPAPVRVGRPDRDYPWPWSVVPWFPGTPGDRAVLTEPGDAAGRLGHFLGALHQEAPPDAPHNPYRSVPLSARAETFERQVAASGGAGLDGEDVRRWWARALDAQPWAAPPTWLHGDLHPANTVVAAGTLAAVVDFGDVCAGDPATDLAGAWMLLPADALPTFFSSYGGVDEPLQRRAVGWAILFSLMFISVPCAQRPTYEAVGRSALAKVLSTAR